MSNMQVVFRLLVMLCLVYYFRVQMKLSMNYYESPQSPLWMIEFELFYCGNKIHLHYMTKRMRIHKQYNHVLSRMHFKNMEH